MASEKSPAPVACIVVQEQYFHCAQCTARWKLFVRLWLTDCQIIDNRDCDSLCFSQREKPRTIGTAVLYRERELNSTNSRIKSSLGHWVDRGSASPISWSKHSESGQLQSTSEARHRRSVPSFIRRVGGAYIHCVPIKVTPLQIS